MRLLVAFALVVAIPSIALADEPEPVPSVAVPKLAPPARRVALELDPFPFLAGVGKLEAELVVVPVDHHALVIAPYFTYTKTAPIYVFDSSGNAMQLPEPIFRGPGVELGYRYYSGLGGPRGAFIGPSLIFAAIFEKQGQYGDGSTTNFYDLGLAVDAGYQALVADKVALAIGVGVQGTITTQTIPDQQYPAKLYANNGIWPRLLLSIGWAF